MACIEWMGGIERVIILYFVADDVEPACTAAVAFTVVVLFDPTLQSPLPGRISSRPAEAWHTHDTSYLLISTSSSPSDGGPKISDAALQLQHRLGQITV